MNSKLKRDILKNIEKISLKQNEIEDFDTKFNNILDIANLVKLIENYEEFEPEIKEMLNKKAYREKWKKEEK